MALYENLDGRLSVDTKKPTIKKKRPLIRITGQAIVAALAAGGVIAVPGATQEAANNQALSAVHLTEGAATPNSTSTSTDPPETPTTTTTTTVPLTTTTTTVIAPMTTTIASAPVIQPSIESYDPNACAIAIAYLNANEAPGFEGNNTCIGETLEELPRGIDQASTEPIVPNVCLNNNTANCYIMGSVVINVVCEASYMNEASNTYLLTNIIRSERGEPLLTMPNGTIPTIVDPNNYCGEPGNPYGTVIYSSTP